MIDCKTFYDSIPIGIVIIDLNKRIAGYNRAAGRVLCKDFGEILGRPCCEVFQSPNCKSDCAVDKIFSNINVDKSGKTNQLYFNLTGRVDIVGVSVLPMRDAHENIFAAALVFHEMMVKSESPSNSPVIQIGEFRSCSTAMQKILANFRQIAEAKTTVLITGETGTGKEILARTIHQNSPRADGPFIAFNCGAFPEPLLESELFGYKQGAFTGADREKPGRFKLADGGTIFLDEIGEISPAMQVRLLRVLQERCFEPLGSVQSEKTDIRVIAATNCNLEEMVQAGTFRSDLYYRINVIRMELPPLRERPEDLAMLASYFIRKQNRVMNKRVLGTSDAVHQIFFRYNWPGNIRELENVIERSMVFCNGNMIEVENLPEELVSASEAGHMPADDFHMARVVQNSEIQAIEAALEKCGGNRRQAAELLGIHPTSLYRKLKKVNKS